MTTINRRTTSATKRPTRKPAPHPLNGLSPSTPEFWEAIQTFSQAVADATCVAVTRFFREHPEQLGIGDPVTVKHVIRDADGKITTVIEENATLRTVQ